MSEKLYFQHQKISATLGLGIWVAPYIFSWFLIKKDANYSPKAKFFSFAWMVFVLIFGFSAFMSNRPEAKAAYAAKIEQEVATKKAGKEAANKAAETKALRDQVDKLHREVQLSAMLICEKAVKSKIDLPHTVDFDIMSMKFSAYDVGLYEMYNAFDYKNRFNAPLRAAFMCKVDAKKLSETGTVKLIDLKIGRE